MSEKFKTAADLVERHKQYCFGEFDEYGQQMYEGDIPMLCNVAGISATYSDDRYKPFAEYLLNARQFNVSELPQKPLDINRLGASAGAGVTFMDKIFGKDVTEAQAAVNNAETLDLSAAETRDEIIERVLADTSAIVEPVAAWLAKGENFRTGHFMASQDYVYNFVSSQAQMFCAVFPSAETLFERVNTALERHGLALLPDEMAGPRHNVAGAGHLRAISGGKKPAP